MIVASENPSTVMNAVRTAVAAVLSYLVARLFHMPEAYWASISTMVVMQPTLGAALPISAQRFAGTGVGALVGAFTASYFPGSLWAFGVTVFLIGLLCAGLRIERSAYRYASVTLAIIVLVPRSASVWLIATHRFLEVSIGVAVGLMLSAAWPEGQPGKLDLTAKPAGDATRTVGASSVDYPNKNNFGKLL